VLFARQSAIKKQSNFGRIGNIEKRVSSIGVKWYNKDMRNSKGQFKKGFTWRNKKPFWDKEWLTKEYITPERQSFYVSQEWKRVCIAVWKRDNATCCRCGAEEKTDMPFHIHHIKSFRDKELRADINNLVLLCESCHQWVHSKGNKNNDYIR
jgi:5-methylcytosine-specific restriction enzyme A